MPKKRKGILPNSFHLAQPNSRALIKNQIFKFRVISDFRRQPEIRIRSGAGGKKKQGFCLREYQCVQSDEKRKK